MPRLKYRNPKMCRDRQYAYVKLSGERIPLGQWGTPEAQETYDRVVSEWLSAGRQLPQRTDAPEPDETTITMIAVDYVKRAEQRYDPGRIAWIKMMVKIVRHRYGSTPAEAFGPKRLRVVRDAMIREGWSRNYINEQVRWVRSMFKWAASHELIDERVYRRLQTVEPLKRGEGGKEREPVKPVPRREVRMIRRHIPRQVRALIDLQLLTAARADELVRLRAVDLDTSGDVWTYRPDDHKSAHKGKHRTIYFGARAQRVLRLFMIDRPVDATIFSPRQAVHDAARQRGTKGRRPNQKATPRATDRTVGDSYSTQVYRRAIHRGCKAAGIDAWGPHRLRHNAATRIRRDYGVEAAQVILGHARADVTQIYAERDEAKAVEIMREVG